MQDKDFIPDPSRKATDEQEPMIPIKKVLDLLEALWAPRAKSSTTT